MFVHPDLAETTAEESTASRKWGRWLMVIAGLALGVWALVHAGSGGGEPSDTRLETAAELARGGESAFVTVTDEGHTLVIDGAGEVPGSGAEVETIATVLVELDATDAVLTRMSSTRALDGMQEASWDGLTASWTFHPDEGLDIIVTD